ncbi:thiolase family protein [Vibrio sp. 10N]|uniref:thiolase family protein n=1 Tax=Vibrio sp. 10N TaxID=3058938 RepID=UPI002812A7BA|nr:thiolase family protein [Vibrio sp. 10N]
MKRTPESVSGQNNVYIVAAQRTPMGKFQGALASLTATALGSSAIESVIASVGLEPAAVDEVLMGCVLSAGLGQAPARQAALGAGLEYATPCSTVNKVCGSGMKAVMLGSTQIQAGQAECVIAGGMESMSNAPYLLEGARSGFRIGHRHTLDHMFVDGLQDAYEGELMGVYGQRIADQLEYTREQMDNWATRSASRAKRALEEQRFQLETCDITLQTGDVVRDDELPGTIKLDKIATLKPAFDANGTITAANSSAISDGAAALLLMSEAKMQALGLAPLAIIKGFTTQARQPSEFTLAPVDAIRTLLDAMQWQIDEVDLWEINEAFAVVTQIAVDSLGLNEERVNVNGGACALGHPIGASGARILVTLIHALRAKADQATSKEPLKGIATLCIGGGEATAIAIEVPPKNHTHKEGQS